MALRWADFITPSTLQLAPLLDLLLEPLALPPGREWRSSSVCRRCW